jgi:hypothetical protein
MWNYDSNMTDGRLVIYSDFLIGVPISPLVFRNCREIGGDEHAANAMQVSV